MDSTPDWTASALFSPSKARAQQAQARDWAAVDSWLSKKYPARRVPDFERNEETLQALLTLANLNDSADEQQSQVERVEKAALQSLSRRTTGISDEILHASLSGLSADEHLDTLAELVTTLDCPSVNAMDVGKHIVELTASDFEMKQQLSRIEAQLSALQQEQDRTRQLLKDLSSGSFEPAADTVEKTAEWTRSAKHLKAKIAEYDERIAGTRPPSSANGIQAVRQKQESVFLQRTQLAALESELEAFQDLPSDTRAARAVVESARANLRKLVQERDRLFEGLVDVG